MLRQVTVAIILTSLAACATTRPAPRPSTHPAVAAPTDSAERGMISYYADSLAGNRMANGKPYDPDRATCAHRSHAFGTELEITLDDTGESATCVVSDRGPFVRGRIVDVSKSVARTLGLIKLGIAKAHVEVVR